MSEVFTRSRMRTEPTLGPVRTGTRYRRTASHHPWTVSGFDDVGRNAESRLLKVTDDVLHPGPPFRSGGPFRSISFEYPDYSVKGSAFRDTGTTFISGFLRATDTGFVPPSIWFSGDTGYPVDLDPRSKWGTDEADPDTSDYEQESWFKTKPKIELFSGAVFAAELRDLPKMLRTEFGHFKRQFEELRFVSSGRGAETGLHRSSKRRNASWQISPKNFADIWLNQQFGWAPTISDLKKLFRLYDQRRFQISRLTRQNGQWVRRLFVHEDTVKETVIDSGQTQKVLPGLGSWTNPMCLPGINMTYQVTLREYRKVWSVGRFRFYRPEFDMDRPEYHSAVKRVQRHLTLYGLRISPEAVYEATPWSWLVDYFTNTGQNVSNASSQILDDVAAKYLYLMQTWHRELRFTQVMNFRQSPVTLEWTRSIKSKRRRSANTPFGFSLTGELSPRQLSIMAALGISLKKPSRG